LEFLGERLFEFRNFEAAAAIFKLAVEEFPGYTAGYYYLGKAYEKSGRIAKAIAAYQMAVTKDKLSRAGVDAAFQIKYLKARKY
jgi:tetratricopeptide (TPR) repeat protein